MQNQEITPSKVIESLPLTSLVNDVYEIIQSEAEKVQPEIDRLNKEIEAEKQKRREFEAAETSRLAKLDDKGKLVEFKKQLESIEYPECKDEKNKAAITAAKERIGKICEYLAEQIK